VFEKYVWLSEYFNATIDLFPDCGVAKIDWTP